MTVYVLLALQQSEHSVVCGVFTSLDLARAAEVADGVIPDDWASMIVANELDEPGEGSICPD